YLKLRIFVNVQKLGFYSSKMFHRTLILLMIGVLIASAQVCPPDYCDDIECDPVSCSSGQEYNEEGTFCGCCPTCVTLLSK
ncbi:u35-Nephitoxin-Nsp1a_1, partial [Nephila pilipes]